MTALETVSTARLGPGRAPGSAHQLAFESIVHVNEKGGSFGGTEEYIALLTAQLARRDVRSHLVCGLLTGAVGSDLSSVHIVDGLASRQPRPGTGVELASVIAGLEPDVIYLHNMFDPAAVRTLATLPNRGPLIWYVHDHYLTCLSELRWRRDVGSCPHKLGGGCLVAIGEGHCVLRYPEGSLGPDELRERLSLSRSLAAADAIVVVSEYMRSLLADAEPQLADRIHLLPRPIRDLGALRPRDRNQPGDPAVITVAGRITPEKGLDVLIEALGAVQHSPPIELRIAGVVEHNAYWSHCQRIQATATAANPRLRVTYLGHLDYSATDELFRQSDLVTIPSQWPEPLGAVAIEAMSAGAAVIASHIGGLDTALVDGHNGLLIDAPNVAAWASAIASLLHDPDRARRLGAQAHRDAAGTAAGHLTAFNEIIARARRSRALRG
jgi:glycosyltransferase involved in cell wall biosynthesis